MFEGLVDARLKFEFLYYKLVVTYTNLFLFGELQVCYVAFVWNLLILNFK